MAEIDLLEVLEKPEEITEELFRSCSRHDQFLSLIFRRDFRELFLELHGSFSCREEFELIMNHELDCEDAIRKNEFSGHDIEEFIIEQVLSVAEFKKMNYAERLTGHNWSGILASTDPDDIWKDYCDFSKFDNSDWVYLLTCNPEYADRCPFGNFELGDIDILLREQPGLAEKCGIRDAVGLYLMNDAPYPAGRDDIPAYPPYPADTPCERLSAWLKAVFPEMPENAVCRLVWHICFKETTLLGVYTHPAAEAKAAEISPGLKGVPHLRLQTVEIKPSGQHSAAAGTLPF